ncbi:HNH endonuclease signature motif containing protein [Clostridium perfringens]|uniref:HNH endonuclease n=1 Tax=Clostridium perfringens TaxID=1502 RepID=A0AAE8FUR7_CLOPF|nr:HNH endonuclease signature motif containing protein [Clostridium perfringens]EHK2278499.1 HNH endonuclease [Clostridium perfringens]EIF6167391.1 HNH endonuclease [Clostridium perfringens]ELC8383418.1 HNH endonuclease [Clostridium perfringens]ELC8412767.1 HNH endonuclease [Clostridium perfringens]MDH2473865.1 HNH endonuclease signature motif containing protein [Clostridium perfringens]
MKKIKSWQYDEKDLSFVIKNLDKSSFKRGSHIPIEIRKFFECEDVIYGQKKSITLIYNAENFKAEIEREKNNKIRIVWNKLIPKMKEVFKNEINDFEDSKELSVRVPRLKFTKETAIKYDVEMKTKYSHDVLCELERLDIDVENKTIEEINEVGEVIERVVNARKNQNKFREALFKRECKCKICGLAHKELLIASHIKPWSKSTPEEKLNPFNGFLLCPNHDSLFDKHLISFKDNGEIIISKRLSEKEQELLNINKDILINIEEENKKFLKDHRKVFYDIEEAYTVEKELSISNKEIYKVELEV